MMSMLQKKFWSAACFSYIPWLIRGGYTVLLLHFYTSEQCALYSDLHQEDAVVLLQYIVYTRDILLDYSLLVMVSPTVMDTEPTRTEQVINIMHT